MKVSKRMRRAAQSCKSCIHYDLPLCKRTGLSLRAERCVTGSCMIHAKYYQPVQKQEAPPIKPALATPPPEDAPAAHTIGPSSNTQPQNLTPAQKAAATRARNKAAGVIPKKRKRRKKKS